MLRSIISAALLTALTAAPASAAQMVTVNFDAFGCISIDSVRRGMELHEEGDESAAEALIGPLLSSGDCVVIRRGDRVYLENEHYAPGFSCVRPPGNPYCFVVTYPTIQYH